MDHKFAILDYLLVRGAAHHPLRELMLRTSAASSPANAALQLFIAPAEEGGVQRCGR